MSCIVVWSKMGNNYSCCHMVTSSHRNAHGCWLMQLNNFSFFFKLLNMSCVRYYMGTAGSFQLKFGEIFIMFYFMSGASVYVRYAEVGT